MHVAAGPPPYVGGYSLSGFHDFLSRSRQHLVDELAVDIRQAEVAALEFERQLLVLDPKQMQNGRVDVVNMAAV